MTFRLSFGSLFLIHPPEYLHVIQDFPVPWYVSKKKKKLFLGGTKQA